MVPGRLIWPPVARVAVGSGILARLDPKTIFLALFALPLACSRNERSGETVAPAPSALSPAPSAAPSVSASAAPSAAPADSGPVDAGTRDGGPVDSGEHSVSTIRLDSGEPFDVRLPKGFSLRVVAQGMKRARFMAKSPDGRLFVTDMHDMSDNRKGIVYVLDDFDAAAGKFGKITPYLSGLRNPNSVAFHTDGDKSWLYVALTDRLVRYAYSAGDNAPSGAPEVLATFPDYGLAYKYGGWHLTRTVTRGDDGKIYVAVGSSCNACEEKEEVRATVTQMDPDGKNSKIYVRGLRNAVGIRWAKDKLFATNMGADHLGDDAPDDTFFALKDGKSYGWPYCYHVRGNVLPDPKFEESTTKLDCNTVPRADASLSAHGAPLGLAYFDSASEVPALRDSFLVALHGGSKLALGRGYRVVRVRGRKVDDFLTGFLKGGKVMGRPVDVLPAGPKSFFVTDDVRGAVYEVTFDGG